MLKVYIIHSIVARMAGLYFATTQKILNAFFSTVSTMQGLSLQEANRWVMSRAPMSSHSRTGYENCSFRAALARRGRILIRTALLSGTMTQPMGVDTGLSPDPQATLMPSFLNPPTPTILLRVLMFRV